ncbi:Membrane steroid-binding protein 1 [Rhynchospora pubera]|uniref:Membrane steroid-binding protein 1 n=1 Tax=Rhynchospora pubera TaxID=906938 RepID=A0AAV8GEM7_9POAL|nr:Membrane steroid-binding protein 1 [Rhynchospora pubera]KAJ4803444.1 Membrane steroid-binding protein 1 [Rhynchospora pubera]
MAWHDWVKENICKRNEKLKEIIRTRTGLSPAMFFAVVTVVTATAAASIAVISSFISPPTHIDPDEKQPGDRNSDDTEIFPEPVQVGEICEDELRMYDGSDPEKPILTAIKGQIYDVSKSSMFYGPGGPYELFAGKDHSRALAKMSFEPADVTGDLSGLEPYELETLNDWEARFMSKYTKVGTIVQKPVVESVKSSEGSMVCRDDDISSTSSESDSEEWQLHRKEDKEVIGSHHLHDP